MAISPLIPTLLSFLSPALPYLVRLGEKAVEEAGKTLVGPEVWDKARALWEKLRPKVETKPAGKDAIQNVIAMPDDPDMQAALRAQLKVLLLEDPALLEELRPMAQEVEQIMSAKTRSTIRGSSQTAKDSKKTRQEMRAEEDSVIENSHQKA